MSPGGTAIIIKLQIMQNKLFLLFSFVCAFILTYAQNVGIGTTTPLAKFHVADSSVLFDAAGLASTPGNPPTQDAGRRMMWYADKAAFRVGYTNNISWRKDSIGNYSFAAGISPIAVGVGAVALGFVTRAGGEYSFATGHGSNAFGSTSTALGGYAKATGYHSTSIGNFTVASGDQSTAIGYNATASGEYSIALGRSITASGDKSFAMGNYVSTSGYDGAFVIGDNSTTTVMQSFVSNGFRARFAGGYRLLSNSAATVGVVLLPDGNSWSAISDARLKENFLPVDGESILNKIAAMPLVTWNYKGQDVKTFRHYGPMAQDFYNAFGHDDLGEIGCDTLINQHDFLGVNLIAIQALEKRTNNLQKENELLTQKNKTLEARLERLEKLLVKQ